MQEKDHISVLIMHLGPVLACSCVRSDPHPGNPRPRGILPLAGRRAGASAETPTPRQICPSLLEDALSRDGSSRDGSVTYLDSPVAQRHRSQQFQPAARNRSTSVPRNRAASVSKNRSVSKDRAASKPT